MGKGNMVRDRVLVLGMLLLGGTAAMAQAADGGMLFKQRCQMCHVSVAGQPTGIGPNLAGVVGRKAASTGYGYSPALKASGLKWDKATLDKFLSGPGAMVPGTKMPISVSDPAQRAAIIAYLATLK
jgi:cytochrome c